MQMSPFLNTKDLIVKNKTILYAYDANGNIIHKEICEYSTSNDLVKKEDIAYNYKEDNDYLTSYQGKEIRYDRIGNPIIYKGNQLKWNQKELKKYGEIEFTYNINHIRTKKKALDKVSIGGVLLSLIGGASAGYLPTKPLLSGYYNYLLIQGAMFFDFVHDIRKRYLKK